jgi:hypothetical protein
MMVDRTPEIATLLRQKPAAEGRIQGIGRHNATKAALDVPRDRMETLRRDQNALRKRMAFARSAEDLASNRAMMLAPPISTFRPTTNALPRLCGRRSCGVLDPSRRCGDLGGEH